MGDVSWICARCTFVNSNVDAKVGGKRSRKGYSHFTPYCQMCDLPHSKSEDMDISKRNASGFADPQSKQFRLDEEEDVILIDRFISGRTTEVNLSCRMCTYTNAPGADKCLMCETILCVTASAEPTVRRTVEVDAHKQNQLSYHPLRNVLRSKSKLMAVCPVIAEPLEYCHSNCTTKDSQTWQPRVVIIFGKRFDPKRKGRSKFIGK